MRIYSTGVHPFYRRRKNHGFQRKSRFFFFSCWFFQCLLDFVLKFQVLPALNWGWWISWCVRICLVAQSYVTLCYPLDCSPIGSSVHGILQARILEWVAISSFRGSSQPKDWTRISCTAGRFFTSEPQRQSLSGYNRCSRILPDKLYLEKQCLDRGGHLLLTVHFWAL